MDDLESRLGALMNDPDMMQKILWAPENIGSSIPTHAKTGIRSIKFGPVR